MNSGKKSQLEGLKRLERRNSLKKLLALPPQQQQQPAAAPASAHPGLVRLNTSSRMPEIVIKSYFQKYDMGEL